MNPKELTTTELFDYAIEHGLIPEESSFNDYMYDRPLLLSLVEDHEDICDC